MRCWIEVYIGSGEVSSMIADCPTSDIAILIAQCIDREHSFQGQEIDGKKYDWRIRVVNFYSGSVIWQDGYLV